MRHHFQVFLQHLSLLCHLCHPWGQEFLQFLSLLACLEDLVALCLQWSQWDLDCPLDHQGHALQPCLSPQATRLCPALLFLPDSLFLPEVLMGQLLQALQEHLDHLAFHLHQEALEVQEVPGSQWGPEVPALLFPQLGPGVPRDLKDRLLHLCQGPPSAQAHQHSRLLLVFQGHHCYLWGPEGPCSQAALGCQWSLEDPAGHLPQGRPKAQVFLQDLEHQDFLSGPEHLEVQVHLDVLGLPGLP